MVTDKKSIFTFKDGDTFVICLKGYTGIDETKLLAGFLKAVGAQAIEDSAAEPVKEDDNAEKIAEMAKAAAKEYAPAPLVKEETGQEEAPVKESPAKAAETKTPAAEKTETKTAQKAEAETAEKTEEKPAAVPEAKAEENARVSAEEKAPSGEKAEKGPAKDGEKEEKKDDKRNAVLNFVIKDGPYKGRTFKEVFNEGFKTKSDAFLKDLIEVNAGSGMAAAKSRVFQEYVQRRFKKFDIRTVADMSRDACMTFFDTYSCLCGSNVLSKIANNEGFKDFEEFMANANEEQCRTGVGVLVAMFTKPEKKEKKD